ncbi:HlyD family secretion protein [Tardiphaga robiniae]|uniref:HlyD family secretion protein n=2 Tax=Tardiphaga robiniae TaxID=943830 RepID=A0A7G6U8D4_9BRAD|nr:HlyD family secretion protein [Tardiphaga robiniae]
MATASPSSDLVASSGAPISDQASISDQRHAAVRLSVPVFAVMVSLGLVIFVTPRWESWIGSAKRQTTDDAYITADLTRLSSRVAGEVLNIGVNDFQRVKKGDLLVQIDPADYQAQVDQADASVLGAQAVLENLSNQIELQYATIAQAEAARMSTEALQVEAQQEQQRQQLLSRTDAGTRQRLEQATAAFAKAQADVRASSAMIAAQHHQLEVLQGTKKQRAAELQAAKALLAAAKLRFSYTHIVAPFDGVVSERKVQSGDYVNIGTNLINVVPLPNVYVIANYKETQLRHVKPGQPVEIVVDTFRGDTLRGHVERISPASGSQFALLPPDNSTGNFTKVVQRIPVRIELDERQPLLTRLLPGMSVVANIDTSHDVK